jgi:hypothetical protein
MKFFRSLPKKVLIFLGAAAALGLILLFGIGYSFWKFERTWTGYLYASPGMGRLYYGSIGNFPTLEECKNTARLLLKQRTKVDGRIATEMICGKGCTSKSLGFGGDSVDDMECLEKYDSHPEPSP